MDGINYDQEIERHSPSFIEEFEDEEDEEITVIQHEDLVFHL